MRRMISVNEEVKEIKITEDMYVYHEDEEYGEYILNIEDANTPQKYLINVADVEHSDDSLWIKFNQPVIMVPGWGEAETAGITAGFGNTEGIGIWLPCGLSYSIAIFNGVVVYSLDYQEQ